VRGPNGETPLHVASGMGNVSAVKALLELGVDKDVQDRYRRTAFQNAINGGYYDCANVLLDHG
ncbi:hypothetical protein M434DRAFT_43175, partial [Hypoxylon sp. CO27-5]